jgi:hypothetical protein
MRKVSPSVVTQKANPPLHSILLISSILITCLAAIPNIWSSLDKVATIESSTLPLFPNFISRNVLGRIRVAVAGFIYLVSLLRMTESESLIVNYLPKSKLMPLPLNLGGVRSSLAFTSWSWNLLGLFFLCSGLLTLYVDSQDTNNSSFTSLLLDHDPILVKIASQLSLLLLEIAAPTAMLVSVIVRYVLWPIGLRGNNGTDGLKRPLILIQHNLNIVFALAEVGLLGKLNIQMGHVYVAPMFGICYVLFAWSFRFRWHPSGEPQFPYFFLDTTLGMTTTYALVGLLVILVAFYYLFYAIDVILVALGGGVSVHFLVISIITCFICRFRD